MKGMSRVSDLYFLIIKRHKIQRNPKLFVHDIKLHQKLILFNFFKIRKSKSNIYGVLIFFFRIIVFFLVSIDFNYDCSIY